VGTFGVCQRRIDAMGVIPDFIDEVACSVFIVFAHILLKAPYQAGICCNLLCKWPKFIGTAHWLAGQQEWGVARDFWARAENF
jgi:hypothetical protein